MDALSQFGNSIKSIIESKPALDKSISIKGATDWETAYTKTGDGGGGLMA